MRHVPEGVPGRYRLLSFIITRSCLGRRREDPDKGKRIQ